MAGAGLLLGACVGVETCDEPEFYEMAVSGKRIVAPDNLSGLAAYKELAIPEASPRPGGSQREGCLDRPPTMRVSGEDDESETS